MNLTKDQTKESLRLFVQRRDSLLHEDEAAFEHHLQRFIEFCQNDVLAQSIISPLQTSLTIDVDAWWSGIATRSTALTFPSDATSEFLLRYMILQSAVSNPNYVFQFGIAFGKRKRDEWIELFRIVVIRPFADEMTHRLGDAANIASPEERALQAVPIKRIPKQSEVKIFLSHKTVDKPLVYRYYQALQSIDFVPWLDDPDMPAGTNLEREVLKGFTESCAAVFFITQHFQDEKYLATEIEYAIIEKRNKGKKFAIITLRYPESAQVPGLLTPYVYKNVANDLEGFREIIRALPIESGPVRWKANVVDE